MASVEVALQDFQAHLLSDLPADGFLRVFSLVDISGHKDIGISAVLFDQKDPVQFLVHNDHTDRSIINRKPEFLTVGTVRNHTLTHQILLIQFVTAVHTISHFHVQIPHELQRPIVFHRPVKDSTI